MTKELSGGIAARLRVARQQAGFTQQEAADQINCRRQVISAIERGRAPTMGQLYELLLLYGASADRVLFDVETIPVGGAMITRVFRDRILAEVDQPWRI